MAHCLLEFCRHSQGLVSKLGSANCKLSGSNSCSQYTHESQFRLICIFVFVSFVMRGFPLGLSEAPSDLFWRVALLHFLDDALVEGFQGGGILCVLVLGHCIDDLLSVPDGCRHIAWPCIQIMLPVASCMSKALHLQVIPPLSSYAVCPIETSSIGHALLEALDAVSKGHVQHCPVPMPSTEGCFPLCTSENTLFCDRG